MQIPTSTYRLQFRDGMTFEKAIALIPYLKALGISHLYASPIFAAVSGSTHGYDIINPDIIDPALGGRDGFEALAKALKAAGLSLLLDIVPNHMAASLENPWWRDVIEWGRASRHAACFDIDWEQRLTLPFLGESFDEALANGHFRLVADRERGDIALAYHDQLYPLNPSTYSLIFRDSAEDGAHMVMSLAEQASSDAEEIFHGAVRALLSGPGGAAIETSLHRHQEDHDFLRHLHEAQSFKLMDWKLAAEGLSYRRFFEIAGLVGIRVEDPDVFEAVHRTVFGLLDAGHIQGLRIDHIDGLADPLAYLDRLRERIGPDNYLIVEKILGADELLSPSWPVQGTTGYEFISALAGLLGDPDGIDGMEAAYRAICGSDVTPAMEKRLAKQLMIRVNFKGEVSALRAMAAKLTDGQDNQEALSNALEELLIAFPVYRTYGGTGRLQGGLDDHDKDLLAGIAGEAEAHLDAEGAKALREIVAQLRGDHPCEAATRFRTRFQQLTGPLMAKAIEDTLFFRHNGFLALNEVGGDINEPDKPRASFHDRMIQRLKTQPHGLNATSTHDTKRGEDARARLLALCEDPESWISGVARWRQMNAAAIGEVDGKPVPDPAVEWMIYQSLAGIWPCSGETLNESACRDIEARFRLYLEKASREAKRASNWSAVNPDYETAVQSYASHLLHPENREFREDFRQVLQPFIRAGMFNSLSQSILKLTAPGVPDIYQGSEQMDLSFVDPDNRRPPDFPSLQEALSSSDAGAEIVWSEEALSNGGLKQQIIRALLHIRREHPELFADGGYQPLGVEGQNRDHLLGFVRRHGEDALVVVVPRLTLKLQNAENTEDQPDLTPQDTEPSRGLDTTRTRVSLDSRTRVLVPDDLLDRTFLDIFTGREIRLPDKDPDVSAFAAAGYSLLLARSNGS